MKLSYLNFERKIYDWKIPKKSVINDGYARTFDFDYDGDQVTDPRPKVLSLGHWVSPRGNDLLAGVNLNYLTNTQIRRLQKALPEILKDRNLKRRYWNLRDLLPDIASTAYRTYKKDAVYQVTPGTLKFLKLDEPDDIDPGDEETPRHTDAPRRFGKDLTSRIKKRHDAMNQYDVDNEEDEEEEPLDPEQIDPEAIGTDETEPEKLEDDEDEVERP